MPDRVPSSPSARPASTRLLGGVIVLAGLGVVVALDAFWPWIIAVFALASAPYAAGRGGWLGAALVTGWLVALAAIIDRGWFWPGILVLLAALLALRFIITRTRPAQQSRRKPTRRR